MVADTRFAPSPGGPVAYRLDGDGGRWLLVVGDRTDPYGPPGPAGYDAFVSALAARGWRIVTVLDGRGPRAVTEVVTGTDQRIAAIRAVAEGAGATDATVLGVGSGAVAAAVAVSGGPAGPAWAAGLIIYGSFSGAAVRGDWMAHAAGEPSSTLPAVPVKAGDREKLAVELEQAKESLKIAREVWERWRPTRGGRAARDADRASGGALSELAELIPNAGPLAGLGELVRRPDRWEGGIEDLIQQVTRLEGGGEHPGEDVLARIGVPAVVADTSGDADSAGLEIAARIPGARHRALVGEPEVPWTDAGPTAALLALLDDRAAGSSTPTNARQAEQTPSATRVLATLLFTDIVASTERLAEMGDAAWRDLLERHHAVVRGDLARFGGREIDNAGDGFLASFATPAPAIGCALAAIGELAAIGLAIRCGLHTGECEQIGGKLGGIAVHIGARIAAKAAAGEVLVSGTVRDLVAGSGITFADRGTAELKGLPGTWPIFAVTGSEGGEG